MIIATHPKLPARVMQFNTAHGVVLTPIFMPVGTRAGVNCLLPKELRACNSQIILGGNTYHMLCDPGLRLIEAMGGMHQFMAWSDPMLTDSGGFQVFSLANNEQLCTIDEQGAHFKHPNDKSIIHLTPETSLAAQKVIGADIIMAFDQCTPLHADREATLQAMNTTHRWLQESVEYHQQHPRSVYGWTQALFGIIQGGDFPDLRRQSMRFILDMPVDGIAIGGAVIGFDMEKTKRIVEYLQVDLPIDKPRYTMGVGSCPQDLIEMVARGIDMFDCVAPTRNARHGMLYSGKIERTNDWIQFASDFPRARLSIKKQQFANDGLPIMEDCSCYTCQHYSRAYLHYLLKAKSPSYANLACIHNVSVMHQVCDRMRELVLTSSPRKATNVVKSIVRGPSLASTE